MDKLTESVRDRVNKMIDNRRSALAIFSGILAILILLISPDIVLGLGGIRIDKQPDDLTVVANGSASFTLLVTNAGDVPLSNVVVADAQCDVEPAFQGGDDNNVGILDLAETWTYTCSIADVGTVDFDNVATANAVDPNVGPVDEALDTTPVDVINPAIAIQKTPDTQQVPVGSPAAFSIRVENTGVVTLTTVTVSDPLAPDCDGAFATLAVGEVQTYQCTATVTGDFTNTASVTATPPTGPDVSDSDTADVSVAAPAIAIVKTTNGQDADTPPGPYVQAGVTVTWSYSVTNIGNVTLTGVRVVDSHLGFVTCDEGRIPDLGLGETFVCTTSGVATVGQYSNTGWVTAKDPYNQDVTNSDVSHYFGIRARLALEKTADVATALVGDNITYTYMVTNIGNVSLRSIALTDDKLGSISLGTTTLAPGISTSGVAEYTVASSDLPGPLQNTAQVTGESVMSSTVTATANAFESVTLSPLNYIYLPMISHQSCLGAGDIDFESGDFSGWDVGGQLGHAITTEAHCGNRAALLGNPDYSCTSVPVGSAWMRASFFVPDTSSPTLTFWYRTLTYDANPGLTNEFDSFDVRVAGSLGFRYANQIDVLSCSTRRDSGWRQKTIDLSAYRGQNATIEFQNHNRHDSFYNTWTYIDDITLEP